MKTFASLLLILLAFFVLGCDETGTMLKSVVVNGQPETEPEPLSDYSIYDLNQDGFFTRTDPMVIFFDTDWEDINGDGVADGDDYWHVQNYVHHPFPSFSKLKDIENDTEFSYTNEELGFYIHFGYVVFMEEETDGDFFWERIRHWVGEQDCSPLPDGVIGRGVFAPIPTLFLFETKDERNAYFADAFPRGYRNYNYIDIRVSRERGVYLYSDDYFYYRELIVIIDDTETYYALYVTQKGLPCLFEYGKEQGYLPYF